MRTPQRQGLPSKWGVAVALACLLAWPAAAQACVCDLAPQAVCGSDGITYTNKCVASCQGVEVVSPGQCSQGGGAARDAKPFFLDNAVTTGTVSLRQMTRYRSEGFQLIGKVQLQEGSATQPVVSPGASGGSRSTPPADNIIALRVTPEGWLYAQTKATADARAAAAQAGSVAPIPASDALPSNSRKLLVTQPDNRVEVSAHYYPLTAVGYIKSQCSGALVGPRTVLTAGHCVYDLEAKAFMKDLTYIPARHGGGTHCNYWDANDNCLSWDTEKEYTWESATTYWQNAPLPSVDCGDGKKCWRVEDFIYDFAVIILKDKIGGKKKYGSLGFGYPACDAGAAATIKYSVTAAGYPFDLPPGDPSFSHLFLTSGTMNKFYSCAAWDDATNGIVSTDLDTIASGQGGASAFDRSNMVRGIVACVDIYGVTWTRTMTKWVYDFVLANRV